MTLPIGNASSLYGDRSDPMREMLTGGGPDVLTGGYLAELTMLILGLDRLKDPVAGYARARSATQAGTATLKFPRQPSGSRALAGTASSVAPCRDGRQVRARV